MHSNLFRICPILLFARRALSWGDLGHRTIAYLSESYMTPQGLDLFHNAIKPDDECDECDVSDASVWADRVKHNRTWSYTYNWHFIDARDSPPTQCNVQYDRDCDERDHCDRHKEPGCVVSAIANQYRFYHFALLLLSVTLTNSIYQTAQITQNGDPDQVQIAMKFLLHFLGDIHQPLHAENLDVGGNSICIQWNGRRHHDTDFSHSRGSDDHSDRVDHSQQGCPKHERCSKNLHQVWDDLIIEKLIDYRHHPADQRVQAEKAAAQNWARDLFNDSDGNPELDGGDCVPTGGWRDAIDCALEWATESNNFVCSYVLKDGVEGVEDQELSGDYYEGAVPIVKNQITRAARRFAATVNAIAAAAGARAPVNGEQVVMEEL